MRNPLPAPAAALAGTLLVVVCACSPSPSPSPQAEAVVAPAAAVPSHLPGKADMDRVLAEGPEPTLQKLRPVDYWLHYKLMQATGVERELGGEAQAIAALQALGDAYERKLRGAEADLPKLVPAAFTGEGMDSGFTGMGLGGFVGLMTGGMLSGAVSSMSDKDLAELVKQGPIKFGRNDGNSAVEFGKDGSLSQSMEFEVNEDGLNGKVRIKTRMDACPDPQGRVSVDIDVDSQMSVSGKPGTGGYVRSNFKYERYLDDDAHLIDTAEGGASNLRISMGGSENFQSQSVDITTGRERGGKPIFEHHGEQGFSIFRPGEVERTRALLQGAETLQTLIAEVMLRGLGASAGSPWESGRCIDLQVTSSPGKRKGIKPNTAFDIDARPRAKADGAAAGGTVAATLSGGASLQPASGKVRADAKYQYAGPAKKREKASIDFESRSKRGVGKASLGFDTNEGAYRVKGGQNDFVANTVVCSLDGPFDIRSTAGIVMHMSGGEGGGSWTQSGNAAGVAWSGGGSYTLALDGDGSGRIEARGSSSIATPMGRFSDSVEPVFSVTRVDQACD